MAQRNGERMTVQEEVIQRIIRASEREEAALRRGDTIREFTPPQTSGCRREGEDRAENRNNYQRNNRNSPNSRTTQNTFNPNQHGDRPRRNVMNQQASSIRVETTIYQGQPVAGSHRVRGVTTSVATRPNAIKVTVALMILMIIAGSAKEMAIIYTNMAGAHVSYNQFKLIYHADIKLPYVMKTQIEALMEKAETTCSEIGEALCEAEMNELREKMLDTQRDLGQINSYDKSRRERRSWCDTCGWAMKKMYGVMDSEAAHEYASKINQLQNETLTQHDLMKQQLMLSEATLETNRNITQKLDERTAKTIKDLQELEDELVRSEMKEYFDEIAQLVNIMLERQSRAIQKIKMTLRETSMGGIPELIPSALLEEDIQRIQEALPADEALPIHIRKEPANNIFAYTRMRASKIDEKVLIEISIPIVSRMEYRLLKATPIPFEINGYSMIVQPQTKYFLLDRDETRYIALNERDMLTEMRISERDIIYRPSAIIRLDKENICEWRVFGAQNPTEVLQACKTSQIPTANYVMEVNEDDIYYISITQPLVITEVCNNNIVSRETLNDDRLLKLRPNCSIRTTQFTIQARNTYEVDMDHIITPDLGDETISDQQLQEIMRIPFTRVNISDPILITEYHQLDHLIEQTKEQARKADYTIKFERIQEETTRTSRWTVISGALMSLSVLAPMIGYILYKAGAFKCSAGTSTHVTIVSTAGNTPYPVKKAARKNQYQSEEMI